MIPWMESAGGNCQDAVTLLEEHAVTVKTLGACEGTEIDIFFLNIFFLASFHIL